MMTLPRQTDNTTKIHHVSRPQGPKPSPNWYHYITLCPPFFTLDTLRTKINGVEEDLANGYTAMVNDMRWIVCLW
jgi:hypothetical protein